MDTGLLPDPYQTPAESPSEAVQTADKAVNTVLIELTGELRVARGIREWILQVRGPRSWRDSAFCGTKEGLLLRVREHLLKAHLDKLGCYQVKRVKLPDSKTGVLKYRNVVTREMLDATDAARVQLKRGDVASFGDSPEAWAKITALPDYFPKKETVEALKEDMP